MQEFPYNLVDLKNQYIEKYNSRDIIKEFVPLNSSEKIPITKKDLQNLHQFLSSNPIYNNSEEAVIDDIKSKSYTGDINYYWLNAKKNENNYQPFYPTWILSAYTLCDLIKGENYSEIIDIGSGDGRLPYCGTVLNIRSISIEIDKELSDLQKHIMKKTGVRYEMINSDATTYNYNELNLIKPMICISALPEIGEILALEIISKFRESSNIETLEIGFCFIGNSQQGYRRQFNKNDGCFGWAAIIKKFGLKIFKHVNLPTHWTNDVKFGTSYLLTK
ncbi:MAG: hypothetical protein DA328_02635 [Nitrososphaeraceae archaeon]|nr:hypothetical protein [Nitrososphaeraceae archaeon]